MSYYLYLVETKKEYTKQIVNILTPFLYEGITSIYQDARAAAGKNEVLKVFQSLLRQVPKWSQTMVLEETKRIMRNSSSGDLVEQIIKAVIKSNIMILTNTPPDKKDGLKIAHNITSDVFIHNCYIEVARAVFNNPYLFYHEYSPYELKKNQREAHDILKMSIQEAIRKMLPLDMVLKTYLGGSFESTKSDDFEVALPQSDSVKLRKMLRNEDPVQFELVKQTGSSSAQQQQQQPPAAPSKASAPLHEAGNMQLVPSDGRAVLSKPFESAKAPVEPKTSELVSNSARAYNQVFERANDNDETDTEIMVSRITRDGTTQVLINQAFNNKGKPQRQQYFAPYMKN